MCDDHKTAVSHARRFKDSNTAVVRISQTLRAFTSFPVKPTANWVIALPIQLFTPLLLYS